LETFFFSESFVLERDDGQKKNRAKEDETKENMSKQEAADENIGGLGAFWALHFKLSRHKIDTVKPAET
jgi:hypothetical protein